MSSVAPDPASEVTGDGAQEDEMRAGESRRRRRWCLRRTREPTVLQRRSLSSGWSACLWPSLVYSVPAIVPGAIGYGLVLPVVGCSSGRGSASRSARSSRPMTRSLVSGKRCP
jgi:hypothetical protein